MHLPDILPLAMRFVATSFIVLCEAPDDLIADIKHALIEEINSNQNLQIHYGFFSEIFEGHLQFI